MIRAAIVEDDVAAFDLLREYLEKILKENGENINIVHYDNAEKFLADMNYQKDLVIMDIELPGINGMDAAIEYRENNKDSIIIFVTNMAQFAVKGYEAEALDFIVKPINYYDFSMKIKRALRKLRDKDNDLIIINLKDGLKRIKISDLYYVEILNHRLIYHTKYESVDIFGSLKELETHIKKYNFSKCNKCYLVNLKNVSEVNNETVKVGNDTLQISRRRKKIFLDDLTKYCGGGR